MRRVCLNEVFDEEEKDTDDSKDALQRLSHCDAVRETPEPLHGPVLTGPPGALPAAQSLPCSQEMEPGAIDTCTGKASPLCPCLTTSQSIPSLALAVRSQLGSFQILPKIATVKERRSYQVLYIMRLLSSL